ncbi:MAG: acyl-CoA thioesterase [Flavobacteriales bacterium]|nr:acyl-CoA thioesterase [Flavobacteriales bacterium]
MHVTETKLRVRYAETDRMGYVYYGNYAIYFEVARVDAMKSLGISYRELEDQGVLMPVYEFSIRYLKPAYYDDELTIRTIIEEVPKSRIVFRYETYNENGDLINEASTTLVFMDKLNNRPTRVPEEMAKRLEDIINDPGRS